MVGVRGSIPLAPTKFTNKINGPRPGSERAIVLYGANKRKTGCAGPGTIRGLSTAVEQEVERAGLPVIVRPRADEDPLDDKDRHAHDADARRDWRAGLHLDHVRGHGRAAAEARLWGSVGHGGVRDDKLVAGLRADPVRVSGYWDCEQAE
jgi:hypothetical protein